ncbi:type II toxin-antitoxin system VapC family toxin [Treponema putidum]|uniref:type II toxin-antitoxin system VapC family toxin n=1 Tax=Treponema putidum TaxID=221027 RepID=UPI003D94CF90
MILILDASAAIEIVLNMKNAEAFKNSCMEADIILAPDIYPSEITNVFWKYRIFSNLDLIKCEKGIEYCIDLIDDFVDTRFLCNEVYAEAVKYKHPAYDIFYLIAARKNNAKLLTCDKKLKKIAIEMGVKLIA